MSFKIFFAAISAFRYRKPTETISYDALFKGTANTPSSSTPGRFMLPGLRPLPHEADAYFKDVFAGPVF